MSESTSALVEIAFSNLAEQRLVERAATFEHLQLRRHDLRSALTGVVGSANLLGLSDTLEEVQRWVDQLLKSADQVLELIDRVRIVDVHPTEPDHSTIAAEVGRVVHSLNSVACLNVSARPGAADATRVDTSFGRLLLASMCQVAARYLDDEQPVEFILGPAQFGGSDPSIAVSVSDGIRPETPLSQLLDQAQCGGSLTSTLEGFRIDLPARSVVTTL
ncbi:MAG: hypothetical protein KDB86_05320 [Actinobacteria bacterium]|nr:hypothetical protein [Actinomycetota bacterium]